MNVIQIPFFKSTPSVHVSLDIYSSFICASPRSEEANKHFVSHCLHAYSTMGIPKIIKTDNRSGHTRPALQHFCSTFQIQHITGIPYNPQGQGMVGKAHLTLKTQLFKQKGEKYGTSPTNLALFTLNFLSVGFLAYKPQFALLVGPFTVSFQGNLYHITCTN